MVEIEKDLFKNAVSLLRENRNLFEKALVGNGFSFNEKIIDEKIQPVSSESKESEDLNMVLVRILKNLPEFVSETGKLGPFESNQIVRLPEKEAQLLVEKKFAEPI